MNRFIIGVLLATTICLPKANGQDLFGGPDGGGGDVLSEIESDLSSQWWNAQWKLRRLLLIEDTGALLNAGKRVLLATPSPRLLRNTRPVHSDLHDLRIIDSRGRLLPCGVLNFDLDDGDYLWVELPREVSKLPLNLRLYYGNSAAEPAAKPWTPDPRQKPVVLDVILGPEEAAPNLRIDALADPARRFLPRVIVVEAETLHSPDGRRPPIHYGVPNPHGLIVSETNACGQAYVAPTIPWRPAGMEVRYPYQLLGEANLPPTAQADRAWAAYLRYRVTDYYPLTHPRRGAPHTAFHPFRVRLDDQTFDVGQDQERGPMFRWQKLPIELPAGRHDIEITMERLSGADALLFTDDPDYRPDYEDVTGPVWMRFRVVDGSAPPCYVNLFCVHTPWSTHGPQGDTAAWLFRDRAVTLEPDMVKLKDDQQALIPPGQWSPWGRAVHSKFPVWWSQIGFVKATKTPRPVHLTDVTVEFQIATQPDASRVVQEGVEKLDGQPWLYVLMPEGLDLAEIRRRTMSFGQWARQRWDRLDELKLDPIQGPRQVVMATMMEAWSTEQVLMSLKIAQRLGFNTLTLRTSDEELQQFTKQIGMDLGTLAHHWTIEVDLATAPKQPLPGMNYAQTVESLLKQAAGKRYSPDDRAWTWSVQRTRMLIMGDEIGPSISTPFINISPLMTGYFREYLQKQNLTPEFFGFNTWDEVKPRGYERELGCIALNVARSIDPNYLTETQRKQKERDEALLDQATSKVAAKEEATPGDYSQSATMEAEEARATEALGTDDLTTDASLHEKRLYHWTQRFRSQYTSLLHQVATGAIRAAHAQGRFDWMPAASPNFQAHPALKGMMWDGALNLFELGRDGALDVQELEDWTWSPGKVAFGMTLMRAAASGWSHRDARVAALLVGGQVETRMVANLAQGVVALNAYLYGPRRVIGPPWAEHTPTLIQWHRLNRWLGKHEDAYLATKNRPAQAAILVANTTEINSRYYPVNPWERQDIFMALAEVQVPVDVVSEEQIIEDDALSRLKVLYVGDAHVDSRAQQRIAAWVAAGGVLWGSYAALARQEYDEPAPLRAELFGLKHRAALEPLNVTTPPTPGHRVTVSESQWLKPVSFAGVELAPQLEPMEGAAVLATFETGTPAITLHRHGKGVAILAAVSAHHLFDGHRLASPPTDEAVRRRRIAGFAADLAGLHRHVPLTTPAVMAFVRESPQVVMVFLVNLTAAPLPALNVPVVTSAKVAKAEDINGKVLAPVREGDTVHVTVDLPGDGGQIVTLFADP